MTSSRVIEFWFQAEIVDSMSALKRREPERSRRSANARRTHILPPGSTRPLGFVIQSMARKRWQCLRLGRAITVTIWPGYLFRMRGAGDSVYERTVTMMVPGDAILIGRTRTRVIEVQKVTS